MHFCSLKVQNLVLRIDFVNRPTAVYSRAYGNQTYKHTAPSILVVFQLIKTWRFNLVNESKVLIITNWYESLNLSNFDLWLIFSKLFYHLVSRTLKTAKWGHERFLKRCSFWTKHLFLHMHQMVGWKLELDEAKTRAKTL